MLATYLWLPVGPDLLDDHAYLVLFRTLILVFRFVYESVEFYALKLVVHFVERPPVEFSHRNRLRN